MAGQALSIPRSLGALFDIGVVGDLSDGQLLERFATGHREELAVGRERERLDASDVPRQELAARNHLPEHDPASAVAHRRVATVGAQLPGFGEFDGGALDLAREGIGGGEVATDKR